MCSSRERYTHPYMATISRGTRTTRRSPLHAPDVTSFASIPPPPSSSSLSFPPFSFCIFLPVPRHAIFRVRRNFMTPGEVTRVIRRSSSLSFFPLRFIHSSFSSLFFFFLFPFVPFLFNSSTSVFRLGLPSSLFLLAFSFFPSFRGWFVPFQREREFRYFFFARHRVVNFDNSYFAASKPVSRIPKHLINASPLRPCSRRNASSRPTSEAHSRRDTR